MSRSGVSAARERTVTIVSLMMTLVAITAYLAFSDSPLSTSFRSALGVDDRLRPAVTVESDGPYAFLNTQPGSDEPVGFSPCREIHYVVNPAGAPAGWEAFVDDAVAEVSARTGLVFTYDGPTDDRGFEERLVGNDRRAEPVLIGWADEREVGDLADDVAGIGGPTMVRLGNLQAYVTGSVVLDRETTDSLSGTRQGDRLQVALLLHELGHLVGLDHVEDPGELMFPEGITRGSYGPGDREGLALLGAIPCA